ncbi:hypothetical protein ACCO45_003968 [Purpureocillium lilacinum]|uniref:Uncharacterized protein n=1 Tax=Purpureocillium lilacinum TaxID=33203 RepID=A0ACC4E1E9_PURLI
MFLSKVISVAVAALASIAHAHSKIAFSRPRSRRSTTLSIREVVSENWCGPVITSNNVTSIEATWVVPSVAIPRGGSSEGDFWFYQWVGIDGTNNCPGLLQAGTGHTIRNGRVNVFSWYEFWPAAPVYPDIPSVIEHCVLKRCYIMNYSTGQSDTYHVSNDHASLCFKTAEWIAEAPGYIHRPAALPAFSTFAFQGCKAWTSQDTAVNLQGSAPWTIHKLSEEPSRQICHSKATSDSDVTMYNW